MLIPGIIYYILFHYTPMYGILIAFKDFNIFKGFAESAWAGLDNFRYLFSLPEFYQVLRNTLMLNLLSLVFGFPAPIIIALLVNEITHKRLSSVLKSTLYLPHFFSWIVIGGIIVNLLSPKYGIVNAVLQDLGLPTVFFLGEEHWWVFSYVFSGIWKEAGWGAIIYIAALAGIDSELYEAARIDGANRWKQTLHVTLPGLKPTIVIMLILKLGQIMEIGFEQPFVLSNPLVYDISDVISTYIYKVGILQSKFSLTTAMGLFQSLIGFIMIVSANRFIKKLGEEGLF
jgi:putative aldouronate transport system permease protein